MRSDGRLIFVCGSSRSGKSHWTARQIARARRLLLWDAKHDPRDYAGVPVVTGVAALARRLADHATAPLRLRYQARDLREFGAWAELALMWGKAAPAVVVAEELADVTSPGKAPAPWGALCRTGLGFGITIYAITQRPAESDKTALGNASVIHCHAMTRTKDRAYMADEMGIDRRLLDELKPGQWIEREIGAGVRTGGRPIRRK